MTIRRIARGLLSMGLAALLAFFPVLSVRAAEFPEETVAAEEITVPIELPEPAQTVPVTEPSEPAQTIPVTEPSMPEETIPMTQPTGPEETTPTTLPSESTIPTQPEETLPEAALPTESTAPTEETVPTEYVEQTTLVTVAQAWATPVGTENLTLRGTVVFASGAQAILQDSTGGIRLSFADPPGAAPGDVMQVTGMRSGGFYVTDFEFQGRAALPVVDTTLMNAPENTRVRIENARIKNGSILQNGFSMTLASALPDTGEGVSQEVCGVIIDGLFYADTAAAAVTAAAEEASAAPAAAMWNVYFGLLHAHTDISDGVGTVTEAFQYAAGVEGLDFFAVTDHSNSFDSEEKGEINKDGFEDSTEWAEGKTAAAAVTEEGKFVGIFGYEMTWPEIDSMGHINTFNTKGWQSRDQEGFSTLESYYAALRKASKSVSQFNHPGTAYGEFLNFTNYSPEYDEVMHLLEVGSEGSEKAYSYYTKALDKGWHLAPSHNQNNHEGSWGDVSAVRTAVLAYSLNEENIYDAIRHYRVYATEDSDLRIHYRLNGQIMGSILGPQEKLTVSAYLEDPTDEKLGLVEVIVDGGKTVKSQTIDTSAAELTMEVDTDYSYYYLRITQPDGDIAVTAPVWVDEYQDVGIDSFTCSEENLVEGQKATLTLTVHNDENEPLILESVDIYLEGVEEPIFSVCGTVNPVETKSFAFPFVWEEPGEVYLTAKVSGMVAGCPYQEESQTLIICYQSKEVPVTGSIKTIRGLEAGTNCQISGYITAGNDNPYTEFRRMLYLQDDSGGIAIKGTVPYSLEVGTHVEMTGVLQEEGGNLVLELTDCALTGKTRHRHEPRTMACKTAINYPEHGGELLQVEGEVVSLTKTASGKGVSRFTVKDVKGDLATVLIEDEIRSSAHGENELASKVKKGRTVRAMGLLHVDEYGKTVLRVRNCDEVVYVPPRLDPTNPQTGDRFWLWFLSLFRR